MATFDFLSLQKSIAGIGDQSRQLPAKLEQSERQREELAAPPMLHNKLTEPLCARVDKIGERSPGHLVHAVRHLRDDARREPIAR